MNIVWLLLVFPFIMVFSPIIAPYTALSYWYDCNERMDVNIVNIIRLDALQCGVVMYSPVHTRYISSPPIQCDIFADCITNLDHPWCKNATILVNHHGGERTCFRFVTNQYDLDSYISYIDSLQLFVMSAIGFVVLLVLISIKQHDQQHYIRISDNESNTLT